MINTRVLDKIDYLLEREEYEEAENILKYWVNDTKTTKDYASCFTYINELIGLYRKNNDELSCLKVISETINMIESENLYNNVGGATGYINIATGYKHFGYLNEALEYYQKALDIYSKELNEDDKRIATLYNNMGIALMDNNELDKAYIFFNKALDIMNKSNCGHDGKEHCGCDNQSLEKAMTYLSLADLTEKKYGNIDGSKMIDEYIDKSIECFNDERLHLNGKYLFVAKKCIKSYEYFGYFLFKNELEKRIDFIESELMK